MTRSSKAVAFQDLLFAFESVKLKHSINGETDAQSPVMATDQTPTSTEKVYHRLFLSILLFVLGTKCSEVCS